MADVYEEMWGEGPCTIAINVDHFEQPAICRINQQLRAETLPLFYDFYFDVDIVDLKFGPHPKHFVWSQKPYLMLEGIDSWNNLKEWLRLYRSNRPVRRITHDGDEDASTTEKILQLRVRHHWETWSCGRGLGRRGGRA